MLKWKSSGIWEWNRLMIANGKEDLLRDFFVLDVLLDVNIIVVSSEWPQTLEIGKWRLHFKHKVILDIATIETTTSVDKKGGC